MIDPRLGVRMRTFYVERNMLFKLHLDLLYACDLDCQHCYLDQKNAMKPASREEIIGVLEQAASLGAMDLLLSGGEIFLRKDLMLILAAARRLKYRIRLKTHGGRIAPEQVDQLVELGVGTVDFSVYAMDDDIHDAFTRKKGSLRRTLQGIDLIYSAGINCEVKCSVSTVNRNHYQTLQHFFSKRNIRVDFNGQIRPTNARIQDGEALNISYDEKVELNLFRLGVAGRVIEPPKVTPPPEESLLCFAGRNALYVAPDLKVYPCSAFPMEVGDLKSQSLAQIWAQSTGLEDIRAMSRARTQGCGGCSARPHCGYCMGKSYLEHDGDYTKPASIVCADAFAWKDATQKFKNGERAKVQKPVQRKPPAQFNIRASHGASPKVTVCGNC